MLIALGLRERAGIRVDAGAVVIAKPNGNVQLRMLSELEMRGCEARWTERNNLYKGDVVERRSPLRDVFGALVVQLFTCLYFGSTVRLRIGFILAQRRFFFDLIQPTIVCCFEHFVLHDALLGWF